MVATVHLKHCLGSCHILIGIKHLYCYSTVGCHPVDIPSLLLDTCEISFIIHPG